MRQSRNGICSKDGCENKILAKRLCGKHYQREAAITAKVNLCGCGCGSLTQNTYLWGHHTRLFTNEEQSRRAMMNDGEKQRASFEGVSTHYRKIRGRHEHRIVAEETLGRPLKHGEIVHHKDHDRRNNHPSNLMVMTQAEHLRLHAKERKDAESE